MNARLNAVLCCVLLSAWCLWPALQQPNSVLIGGWAHPDCLSNHWLLGWVAERLMAGDGILHNDDYYWPVGDSPVLAGNGTEGVLYLPFHALLGWPVGSVGYCWLILVLNGLAGYALARAAGAGEQAGLLAACAAIVFPYPVQELSAGRFSQVAICWPVAAWAAWMGLLDKPSTRRGVLCGVLTAASGFFYWYHALFVCIADLLTLLVFAVHRRRIPGRAMGTAAATALVLIAPWAVLFAAHWHDVPGVTEGFPSPHSVQASAPLLPRVWVGEGPDSVWAMSAPLGLLGWVGAWAGRDRWTVHALLLTVLVFTLLSLGPNIPASPYVALYGLAEPLQRFWWPVRHVVMVNAGWGALAAMGLAVVLSRMGRWQWAGLGLAIASVPAGLMLRGIPTQPRFSQLQWPPEVYVALSEQPPGVLVEPPLWPGLAVAQQHLLYQQVHHKTLLGGHGLWVDRIRPEKWDEFVQSNSFLAAVQRMESGQGGAVFSFEHQDLADLQAQGVRWFSVNRELFPLSLQGVVSRHRAVASALFGDPVIRSVEIQIWDMNAWNGETVVEVEPWGWPDDVRPSGPEISITGRRPASVSFSDRLP